MRCFASASWACRSCPWKVTAPASGRTMFMIDFKVVVFPAPFTPMKPVMNPVRTSNETSRRENDG